MSIKSCVVYGLSQTFSKLTAHQNWKVGSILDSALSLLASLIVQYLAPTGHPVDVYVFVIPTDWSIIAAGRR